MRVSILPSLLAADFSRLREEIARVEQAGADMIHVDVMDGHFVPNITFGPFIVDAIKRASSIPLDVHLMITDPQTYAGKFIDAGADRLTFHIEAHLGAPVLLDDIRERGILPGLSISPDTGIESLQPYLGMLNHVLVMTVHPGFGGQKLIGSCLEKVRRLRELAPDLNIEVDGGINGDTIAAVAQAGANEIVAGTAVFGAENPAKAIADMRKTVEAAFGGRPG